MSDVYLLKHKTTETPLGRLEIDIENDRFSFEKNDAYAGPLPSFLLYESKHISPSDSVKMWVMDRAPEPHNELIDALIRKIGETEYNAYSFFKYNKGRFIGDSFYVESITVS